MISVVIPTYNEERFIAPCLAALMAQTKLPDEIIVVDNNCTDRTIEIAERFSLVRIVTEERQGMIPARNAGFDAVEGDIIARIDADTRVPPNWIERINENFETKCIDALSGPVSYYDLPGSVRPLSNLFMVSLKISTGTTPLFGPGYALSKEIWRDVRDSVCLQDRKAHEDIDLTLCIHRHGGRIHWDKYLLVQTSARRIKGNPISFFGEYPVRLTRTVLKHKRR